MVAAETRGSIAALQAAGTLLWIGVSDSAEEQRPQADHAARLQESANFQLGGMVAAETRGRVAAQLASGSLPWMGVDNPSDIQHLQAAHAVRLQETANVQPGGPGKLTGADDPRHALQKNGGLADLRYVDDGDIVCHPILVPSYLQEFDVANAKVRAEGNPRKRKSSPTLFFF